jgi:hypothetical protein
MDLCSNPRYLSCRNGCYAGFLRELPDEGRQESHNSYVGSIRKTHIHGNPATHILSSKQ